MLCNGFALPRKENEMAKNNKAERLFRKNGKPMFRASYSILQDELFHYMTEQGFKGFQRGEYGSTAEHLTSLQYKIKQDKVRLEKLQKRIQREQIRYEPARNVSKTYNEIDSMGQKTITGKRAISKEDYSQLTALAKEWWLQVGMKNGSGKYPIRD